MKIIFGYDTETVLMIASVETDVLDPFQFPTRFFKKLNQYQLYKGMLFQRNEDLRHFGVDGYPKIDEYCFEDILRKYRNNNPIFILKNKKWFYCSQKTDYLLLPYNGEYSDLTNVLPS